MAGSGEQGLRIDLLGEPRARLDGVDLDLGQPRQRAILAVLALRAPYAVSRSEIVEAVWGEVPPASADGSVHTYVGALRQVLEPNRLRRAPATILVTTGSGDRLKLPAGAVDVEQYQAHVDRARMLRGQRDDVGACAAFEDALRLWRGVPLAGLPGPFVETQRVRLSEARLVVLEEHAEVALRLGRHTEVATDLASHVRENPVRERLASLLMVALYRCGRQVDAMSVYHGMRARLVEELGIEPGPDLRRVYQEILVREPSLDLAAPETGGETEETRPRAPRVVPAQLPHDVAGFTGRGVETEFLRGLLMGTQGDGSGGPVRIASIEGTGGVGKTALAVHLAQQVAEQFTDGQLYVDLRGFDPHAAPATPDEALAQLLRGLGVEESRIPADLDGQIGMYRSLLSGRKVLVLLDNVANSEQVRPLLPGTASCFVLVTSRNRLSGLAARDGAYRVTVDVLSDEDSLALLRTVLGARRVDAEQAAARELVRLCGGLPLALRVAAEQVATHPHDPLAELAGELREEQHRLDLLAAGDDDLTAVRAAFSWSYRALKPDAARLFRLLGVHPGPSTGLIAAAVLLGVPMAAARSLLSNLCAAHLVNERGADRYEMHDLVRIYAAERAAADEEPSAFDEAMNRVLGWYLHTADHADRAIWPGRRRFELGTPPADCEIPTLATHRQAIAWCDRHRDNLVAAARLAASRGDQSTAWRFADALGGYLARRTPWSAWSSLLDVGVPAAQACGERAGEALLLNSGANLARAGQRLQRAREDYERALEIWREIGDGYGEAGTLSNLASVLDELGAPEEALAHYERAEELCSGPEAKELRSMVLTNRGRSLAGLRRFDESMRVLADALALTREIGAQQGEALVLANLGDVHRELRRFDEATDALRAALEIHRHSGNSRGEAHVLLSLADTWLVCEKPESAREDLRAAWAILNELGDPQAAEVAAMLAALPAAGD